MENAAKFYLRYIGKRGTPKQIETLIRQIGPLVFKLAKDRGYQIETQGVQNETV